MGKPCVGTYTGPAPGREGAARREPRGRGSAPAGDPLPRQGALPPMPTDITSPLSFFNPSLQPPHRMLLKSLAALALAAQASALNVKLYSDNTCSNIVDVATVSQGTCVPSSSSRFLAVASCTGTGSGTGAMVALVPNADCSGNPLYGGQIDASACTKLTATGSGSDLWAKIDSNKDGACGSAAQTFSVLNYGNAQCSGSPVSSGSGVVIADGNCREGYKVRNAPLPSYTRPRL
jgi:hypothetical protein